MQLRSRYTATRPKPTRGRRPTAMLFIFLLVATQLVPSSAFGHHDGKVQDAPAVDPHSDPLRNVTTFPTLDQARDDIRARQSAAIRMLEQAMVAQNATSDTMLPRLPARVFEDHVDESSRIGGIGDWQVIGGQWRSGEGVGSERSAAWTMTHPETGHYATMDAILLSPAIDLSAYPASAYPFLVGADKEVGSAYETTGSNLRTVLDTCLGLLAQQQNTTSADAGGGAAPKECPDLPSQVTTQDQVNLVFRHRYNLVGGQDGAQVILFFDVPTTAAEGTILTPMPGYGNYAGPTRALADGNGFSGAQDWSVAAFDLTPWAEQTVHIGFRVATGPGADKNPSYFKNSFARTDFFGWVIDDMEISAPAFANDLKLEAIEGPSYRTSPTDRYDRVPMGERFTVRPIILNAAGTTREARVSIATDEPDSIPQVFARTLRPGEVWTPEAEFNMSTVEGQTLALAVKAWNPGASDGRAMQDPTPANNEATRRFRASIVEKVDVDIEVDSQLVEDNAPVTAKVTVVNSGNVAARVNLQATESHEGAGAATPTPRLAEALTLAPGETRKVTFSPSTVGRGAHVVNVTASTTNASAAATARYYVHASPPDVFFNGGNTPEGEWTTTISTRPVPPDDDWMWAGWPHSFIGSRGPLLRVLPLEAASSSGAQFQDLQLKLRYMAVFNPGSPVIQITYAQPAAGALTPGDSYVVWETTLSTPSSFGTARLDLIDALSWQTATINVKPQAAKGYLDVWSMQGLEIHILARPDNLMTNDSVFLLDDFELTAVPVGLDESWRQPIAKVTGAPAEVSAQPGTPKRCWWEDLSRSALFGNCWTRVNAADPGWLVANEATQWGTLAPGGRVPTLDGEPALFQYSGGPAAFQPDRLTTPVMSLVDAIDPVLEFDHVYTFPSYPHDVQAEARYSIQQIGFVALQFQNDDGSWSEFRRLVPTDEGGYPHPLQFNGAGDLRSPTGSSQTFRAHDGYYHPGPCRTNADCFDEGFINNFGDASRMKSVQKFAPLPTQHATFRLKDQASLTDVDLTTRDIRVAFQVSDRLVLNTTAPDTAWTIGNIRLSPISRFAVDGAVEDVRLEVPFDWRALGVGPGSSVPVNVTVRNAGLYPESFRVGLDIRELNGPTAQPPQALDIGLLAPGEVRYVTLDWTVALHEDRIYTVTARIDPTEMTDENPRNDAMTIGHDGSIGARKRLDLGVDAAMFPTKGRETLARYLPITLYNRGNVDLEDIVVTRTIERVAGGTRSLVSSTTWEVHATLPADPNGVSMLQLDPRQGTREYRQEESFFTPGLTGTYVMTVTATSHGLDVSPDDNKFRGYFFAQEAIDHDDFEGNTQWTFDAGGVWGLGEGFRSGRSLLAADSSTGALAPGTDAAATSPLIRLSNAQTATLNLFTRHLLEDSYDGAVVELSTDGETWTPVPPVDQAGRPSTYATPLVASNPIARAAGPYGDFRAISGDSYENPINVDGWVPLSFDLGAVPGVSEQVTFQRISAPRAPPSSTPTRVAEATYVAPWMVEDPADPTARWEIRNETDRPRADLGEMWWSGYASAAPATATRTLSRDFNISAVDRNNTWQLSWWEWRAGAVETDWTGLANNSVNVAQVTPTGQRYDVIKRMDAIERRGEWNRMLVELEPLLDPALPVRVEFIHESRYITSNNRGWAIEDINFEAARFINGTRVTAALLTAADEAESIMWTTDPADWKRVTAIPSRPAPWIVVNETAPDGRQGPMWKLDLGVKPFNVDSRLVTPAVDLSEVVGRDAALSLVHKWDLHSRAPVLSPSERDVNIQKYGQGGTVEIQIFNRTTGAWDPWRQLFGTSPPSPLVAPRPTEETFDGLPYTHTFPNLGDTFERFPREVRYEFGNPSQVSFVYPKIASTSYVFSNASNGFQTSTFDLTSYVGETARFAFHGWTGADDLGSNPRYWTIASADVVGNVLSTGDARVRLRLGTDASILQGSWAVDDYEVTGATYARSVGVHLDSKPTQVAENGVVKIAGTLTNYGSVPRKGVGIALVNDSFAAAAILGEGGTLPAPASRYAAVIGPFDLGPAGSATATSDRFEILVFPGQPLHRMQVEVVEGTFSAGALSYGPVASDDVPGRAARKWNLATVDIMSISPSTPVVEPPSLAGPGSVTVAWAGLNNGTLPIDAHATITWRRVDGSLGETKTIPLGVIEPGAPFEVPPTPFNLTKVGDHILELVLSPASGTTTILYRVGTSDVLLSDSFEGGLGAWNAFPSNVFRRESDDAKFGGKSILFGVNNTEYFVDGDKAEHRASQSGLLTSPSVDLRAAGPNAAFSFWHKPRLGVNGAVDVIVQLASDATCKLTLTQLTGKAPTWEFHQIALEGLSLSCAAKPRLVDNVVKFQFLVTDADDQGWRLDGVTVAGGTAGVTPTMLAFPVTDSAVKDYPFSVENSGRARKEVTLSIDPDRSKLTASQLQWLSIVPSALTLEPGETRNVDVRVESPTAKGAFPQKLQVALAAQDRAAPFMSTLGSLSLEFRPLARQDLDVAVSIDSTRAVSGRIGIEEATPHEVTAVVTNQGFEPSGAVDLSLEIIQDATGDVVWNHTQTLPPLAPFSVDEDSVVVSASWTPLFGERGNHTLRIIADKSHRLVDYDRSNDDLRIPMDVLRLVRPDLVVDAKSVTVSTPTGIRIHEGTPGQLLQVEGLIRNDGLAPARQVTVRLLAGNSILKEEVVASLGPGDTYLIRANQFAPSETTRYRVLAFTPDLELFSTNNEITVELPIFPPEILFSAAENATKVQPGGEHVHRLDVSNTGPYPILLNLTIDDARRFATVEPSRLALGPGETRELAVTLVVGDRESAGEARVIVRADAGHGLKAQRTMTFDIERRLGIETLSYQARGPPENVRLEFDAVNTGNVAISPIAVVTDEAGTERGRWPLAEVPAGKTRFTTLNVALPKETPPSAMRLRLVLEADGRQLADEVVQAEVERWGRVDARTTSVRSEEGIEVITLKLDYSGNAPTRRQPLALGAPEGSTPSFSTENLDLAPGETTNLTLRLMLPTDVRTGLYHLQLAFLEQGAQVTTEGLLSNATTVPLDLRAAKLTFTDLSRQGPQDPSAGDDVTYVATVRNIGDRAATSVPVALYVNGVLVARDIITDLAPGATQRVKLTWHATVGTHAVIVALDPHGRHGKDAPARGESLDVASSLLTGARSINDIPAPPFAGLLLAILALSFARRRRRASGP